MEEANNPLSGAGMTPAEATETISRILDSEDTTIQNVDAETSGSNDPSVESVDATTDDVDFEPDQPNEADEVGVEAEQTEAPSAFEIPVDALITLKDGEQVSGQDLISGYMRFSDYTRKTQEIAEIKKQYTDVQMDKHVVRAQVKEHLDGVLRQVALEFQSLKEPDWDYLRQYDFPTYLQEKENFERRDAAVKQLADAQNVIARKNTEHMEFLRKEAIKKAKEDLHAMRPEFRDPKTANATMIKTENYLVEYGFTNDEIGNVQDAKIIDIVLKAIAYDEMQKKVPAARKAIESKAPITMPTPGNSMPSTTSSSLQRDINRYRRTGSSQDAISVISKLL